MNSLLYINGLNPNGGVKAAELQELEALGRQGINAEAADVDWRREEFFDNIINRLESRTRELAELGSVAIVGFSAGGSMAMNVFGRVRDLDNATAVSIAGRLAEGEMSIWNPRHLAHAAHVSSVLPDGVQYPNFYHSVVHFERKVLPTLSDEDKQRLLVLKPKHDFVVPLSTMEIDGVRTMEVPVYMHNQAATLGLGLVGAGIARDLRLEAES